MVAILQEDDYPTSNAKNAVNMAVTSNNVSSSSSSQEQQRVITRIPEPQPPSPTTDECIPLCTQWRERLQQCVANYNARIEKCDSDITTTAITAAIGSSYQRWQEQYKVYTAYHFEIYQLRQELQQFWLLYSSIGRNDNIHETTASMMTMQTRHDELRKCQDLLDMIQSNHRDSNGTSNAVPFLFYKYRLRQPTRNLPTMADTNVEKRASTEPSDMTQKQTATTTLLPPPATIEHLTNTTILIDKEGNVQYQTQHPTDDVDATDTTIIHGTDRRDASNIELGIPKPQTITSETIVIRNLSNCHIQLLGNYYKSIYFVKVDHTKIHLYYPILGAIHVTECHDVSFINILQAQQLRLHNSHDIHCYNATIHAGTILEDCHNVTFYVPPSSTTNLSNVRNSIKDFNWLRNGIPSPNFSIQTMSDPNTTTMAVHCSSGSENDPSVNDQGTLERSDQYSVSVPKNDSSDDEEI